MLIDLAHDEAEQQYRIAVQLSGAVHDARRQAEALEKLGALYWALGRYDEALSELDQAMSVYDALADLNAVGRVAGKIGWTQCHRGTGEQGIERLQFLARSLEEAGPTGALVDIYDSLVPLYWRRGKSDELVTAARRAAEIANVLTEDKVQIRGELNRGLVLWVEGCLDDARQVLAEAILELGDHIRAATLVEEGVRRTRASGNRLALMDWLRLGGKLLTCLGRWEEASAALDEGLTLARQMPHPYGAGQILYEMSSMHATRGAEPQARATLEGAICVFQRLGSHPYLERAERSLQQLG